MSIPGRSSSRSWSAAACMLVAMQAGCTSALTAGYLRNGLWDHADHAESGDPSSADTATDADAADTEPESPVDQAADRERREAALAEAMARVTQLGALDPAVEAALVATLQRTQPEDWPVVVDEFAASLTASGTPPAAPTAPSTEAETKADPPPDDSSTGSQQAAAAAPEGAVESHGVASATPTEAAAPSQTDAAAAPPTAEADPPDATPQPPTDASHPPAARPAAPPLAVRTACFASAVRAWGDFDRYAADRFRPGEELIVYVELDNVAAGESPAGHTTCIDAEVRLVDDSGGAIHTWNFEPVAETSAGRRHDYFARYIVRIPDSAPAGGCRIEVAISDTISGSTAAASLPLEIAAAE